ncbi:LURP-one-related family protein [Thermoleptolyngbya sichuanensis XZ-Cy5]|uniref:LURP-one-related/scramblase family protein n=1 Tax=Thermoleptolyngbya sichuanensis TaxID=2885951 RepID=UPI00240DAE1D|nr:LURP-one-related family protein [Thermoleptolyngbya sichuanensis]MDG2618071.1 LURP-one-related family protein [Thermoleptolyngbya sichuanensis XZ-Cy5]
MFNKDARQDRREERQQDRSFGKRNSGNTIYKMREKMISIGDDFFIENSEGDRIFKVNGKALRVRETLIFEDLHGNELCKLQERLVRLKDSMAIESPQGDKLAMVKKALIAPLRDRWVVKIGDGPDLEVWGNIWGHAYGIAAGRNKLAEVSNRWFRLRDTDGVEIEPGQNDVPMLTIAVAIDIMAHES